MHPSLLLPVADKSQAGEARRLARAWTKEASGDDELAARSALVVTELANNLELHTTRGGGILLRKLEQDNQIGLEILSLDGGPGVANFSQCMRDGYSTTGTMGTGLGAVERISHVFETHSQVGVGTALLSQVWIKPPARREACPQTGVVNLAMRGESIPGDSWCLREGEGGKKVRLIVADGLGHGPLAAEAARRALETFSAQGWMSLPALIEAMHENLRGTRGAAVAVTEIDPAKGALRYIGVGNIAASILTHECSVSLVSMNGTVGLRCSSLQEFSYLWAGGSTLVMSSDGLKTQWQLTRYPGLLGRHPSLIAGVLYRDYHHGTDDTTVAVLRL